MKYLLLAAAILSFPALAERPAPTPRDPVNVPAAQMTRETANFWHLFAKTIKVEELQDQADTQAELRRQHCERTKRADPRARC